MRNIHSKLNKPPPGNLPILSILDSIGAAIQIMDVEWNCLYINQAAADLGGKIALEMRGRNLWEAFPELVGSVLEADCRRAMREQVRIDLDFYFAARVQWIEIHLHPSPQYLTLYATEITRSLRAEAHRDRPTEIEALNVRLQQTNEALILSVVGQQELTERADLLNIRLNRAMQESHHRIKNNLQVVAALVEIQMGEPGAAASDEHLQRINLHVRALASIHDLLTHQVKSDVTTDYLDTREVLGRLIPMLQQTSGGRRITAEITNVLLPTDKATALSLLVSECISNAIKHSKGEGEVSLRVEGDNAHLEVCDDGKGFAPDFNPREAAQIGLSLIDSTARHDLRGQVRYDNHRGGGGRVAVTFPLTDKSPLQ